MSNNVIDFFNISIGQIHKLNKKNLIKEFMRRNLTTKGNLIELKSILFKYLKGESTPDHFQNSDIPPFISTPIIP